MPPVRKGERESIRKRVDFVAKDDVEQVATGIVMVPNTVDLQGDFERPETVDRFADQFASLVETGDAEGGAMHAVWPSDHMELESNTVLEESAEIGSQTAPEGAWVQEWHFADSELWGLVDDGILSGYSIGARDVSWDGPIDPADAPDDVEIPDEHPDGEPIWELTDGVIREVSAVDIPAVPDAEILETKADAEKRLADHLGNRSAFIDEAMQRGHSEADAERLWDYLSRAIEIEGADSPGKQSMLAKAGRAFLSTLTGADDGNTKAASEDPDRSRDKEGHTLSQANRERAMAIHDLTEDLIASEVDFPQNRFTDDPTVDFDIDGWTPKAATTDSEPTERQRDSMSEDNSGDEPPEWAKSLIEDVEQLKNERDSEEEKSDSDDGSDKDDDDGEEMPEWAKELAADVDAIKTQGGASQQLESEGATPDDIDEKAARKAALLFGGAN